MLLDANLVLLSGLTFLKEENDDPPFSTTVDGYGRVVIDLKKTGIRGLAAIMVFTMVGSAEYQMSCDAAIEASDTVDRDYEEVAKFPIIYRYLREMACVGVTGFVKEDIGKTIAGDGTGTDSGTLISYDDALVAAAGEGKVVVMMDAADDLFDQTAETLTVSGGTGVCTHALAATVPVQPTPGIYIARFATNKRYVRFNATVVGNWHKVLVFLGDWDFGSA